MLTLSCRTLLDKPGSAGTIPRVLVNIHSVAVGAISLGVAGSVIKCSSKQVYQMKHFVSPIFATSLGPAALLTAARCKTYILSADTFAFEHAGLLSRLPRGAELEVIGEGFSDRTVRVQSNGIAYSVFLCDLEDDADHPASLYS
jgi:hypothetical protein